MKITSASFKEGGGIPAKHTCSGADVAPALAFEDLPPKTKALALICEDPDAPGKTWVHWVAYNIPADVDALPEGLARTQFLPMGGSQGLNDFCKLGYGGPCPPPGKPHRYVFTLYALKGTVELAPGADKEELLLAMKGKILAQASLTGTFKR